jgi:hypothetical protein
MDVILTLMTVVLAPSHIITPHCANVSALGRDIVFNTLNASAARYNCKILRSNVR